MVPRPRGWDRGGMPRTARISAAATAVFAVSGVASGLLIDERSGVPGALAWILRTLVPLAAAVSLAGALALILRLRRRGPRAIGWSAAIAASVAFVVLVAVPVGYGVYLTHLPARRAVHDVDLGAPKRPVTLTTAGGVKLRGWYVPSRNGAAVAVIHGTGSNRLGVADHARLLVRHGYGVLIFDLQGHGASDGPSTSLPARFAPDADAALAYLRARPDVRAGRIGIIGVSLGGEVAIAAAARHPEWRATVLEGGQALSPADMRAAGADPVTFVTVSVLYGVGRVLGGTGASPSNERLIERIAPRPLLLISAGRGTEARANQAYARRAGRSARLWNLPGASHAAALRTDPGGYERRVTGFLDTALR